jgi:hypothetical protein
VARTTIFLEKHAAGVLTALAAAPFPIGDGVAPRGLNKQELDPPYAVLYQIPGGLFDGPISDSQADAVLVYQITANGLTRQQAAVVLDICRDLMKRENIIVAGRKVRDVRLSVPSSGIMRDDDLANPLFYGYDRYEMDTTPA